MYSISSILNIYTSLDWNELDWFKLEKFGQLHVV